MVAICAMDWACGIGLNNEIPWRVKEDFQWFKECTLNQNVILGRKTKENLPTLYNRNVYVLSRVSRIGIIFNADNTKKWFKELYINNLDQIEDKSKENWLCGGAAVYKQFLPQCSEIYITHINGIYEVDTYFPYELSEIISMFPVIEKVKELSGGHKIIKYSKL